MKNYISLGSVRLRISRRYLAKWGYPLIEIGGLSLLTRCNDGRLLLASYHPRSSITWLWAITVFRRPAGAKSGRDKMRRGQWHDYYWLPFGYQMLVSHQAFMARKAEA